MQGHDVTEHHRAMQALHDSEQRYRLLVESAKDYAIVGMDTTGRITSWNVGAERIIGFSESEVIGQPVGIFFTPEDRAARTPEQELGEARAKGRAEDERWHLRKDGSRFFCAGVTTPLQRGNFHGFAKIARDQTSRAQQEHRREAA
ncbi:MAG: PAS domain-containing protein, partial [Gammaproteobacteria bacterium]